MRKIDGRRNSEGRVAEVARLYLIGPVTRSLQLGDSSCVNIEANHWHARTGERDRYWQSNIAEADHCNASSVRTLNLPAILALWPGSNMFRTCWT
jgi:hypothetical protein